MEKLTGLLLLHWLCKLLGNKLQKIVKMGTLELRNEKHKYCNGNTDPQNLHLLLSKLNKKKPVITVLLDFKMKQ